MSVHQFLLDNPWFFLVALILLSLIVGSFLNVVIARLPIMLDRQWRRECRTLLQLENSGADDAAPFNLAQPRSCCPHCANPIRAADNIPIISFLLLNGRCRNCRKPIALRYPLIEAGAAVLGVCAALRFGVSLQTAAALALSWTLLCLAVIDWDHLLLPDSLTLPLLWLGLISGMFEVFTDLRSSLIGAILGYVLLWTVYILFRQLSGKEGMGRGDFKLLAALGAWFGWQLLPILILLAALSGSLFGTGQILFAGKQRSNPIPFGPHLALSGWCVLLWGEAIPPSWLGG